ncbi:LIM domain only protein 7-like isoform X2 [Anguilla rostrata]|uniref:LIM domain only protein 7-like isoform X2 n=1 Tax=Anguilla rostrata TaxID=7938 RepID=UPI0030D3EE3D
MDSPTDHCPEHPHKQQTGQNRGRRITQDNMGYSSGGWATTDPAHWGGFSPWMHEYESQSDSDVDRPEPDVVLDDLASRRFRSPSPATPANYAIPMSPVGTRAGGGLSLQQAAARQAPSRQNLAYLSSSPSPTPGRLRPSLEDVPLTEELYKDSEDEEGEGEEGYADPIQDDLYTRRVGLSHQPSKNVAYDKFLPKYWTPEEDAHVRKIKLGSQRRPWYRKMQGLSPKKSGSSSDDSDCDVSPWLGRPSPARP